MKYGIVLCCLLLCLFSLSAQKMSFPDLQKVKLLDKKKQETYLLLKKYEKGNIQSTKTRTTKKQWKYTSTRIMLCTVKNGVNTCWNSSCYSWPCSWGFVAENFREHLINKEHEYQYITSLYDDLKVDTSAVNKTMRQKTNGDKKELQPLN